MNQKQRHKILQYFESPEAHARVMEAARLSAKNQGKTQYCLQCEQCGRKLHDLEILNETILGQLKEAEQKLEKVKKWRNDFMEFNKTIVDLDKILTPTKK